MRTKRGVTSVGFMPFATHSLRFVLPHSTRDRVVSQLEGRAGYVEGKQGRSDNHRKAGGKLDKLNKKREEFSLLFHERSVAQTQNHPLRGGFVLRELLFASY